MQPGVMWGIAVAVGGWLLFAGPVYQASVELRTQAGIQRLDIQRAVEGVTVHRRIRGWWWFVPPVAVVLQQRQTRRFQNEVFRMLTPAQIGEWVRLTEKATGWWLVAAGAFLIAVYETWRLVGEIGLDGWAVWPISAASAVAAVAFTVLRQRTTARILVQTGATDIEAAQGVTPDWLDPSLEGARPATSPPGPVKAVE